MGFSFWHVIVVLVIILILFGAGRLPTVMGDLAKGVRNFRAGLNDEEEAPKEEPPRQIRAETPLPGATAGPTVRTAVRSDETAKT